MTRTKSAAQMIGALVLVASALAFVAISNADASPAALSRTYTNAAYGFALTMPEDFSAYPADTAPLFDATGAPTGQAIVLQNHGGAAVQIVITPHIARLGSR